MTIKGIQPREIQSFLHAYEQHKGDPAVEAQLIELHARLEDEFIQLRGVDPAVDEKTMKFPAPKQELFEKVKALRESMRKR